MKKIQSSVVPQSDITPHPVQFVCEKRTFSGQLSGVSGPLVVLLHGFPDTWQTFDQQVPALVQAGYRVLVPVMPGYEASSVDPEGRYHVTDLVRWFLGWIDHLGEDKVHLVGHDWGAVTAWLAAAMAPERLHSLTTIAIPSLRHMATAIAHHPSQLLKSWYMAFFQLPVVAEQALEAGDGWLIRRLWRNWSPGWDAPEEHLKYVCRQLLQPGVRDAVLGYYRCLFRVWTEPHRQGRQWLAYPVTAPTLMITGSRDGCMDTHLFEHGLVDRDFPGGIEMYRLMGAGHFCHLEKPERVNAKLIAFLAACDRARAGATGELDRQLG